MIFFIIKYHFKAFVAKMYVENVNMFLFSFSICRCAYSSNVSRYLKHAEFCTTQPI